MSLHKVLAKGTVRLPSASIAGVLVCLDAQFENPKGYALIADGLTAKGDVSN